MLSSLKESNVLPCAPQTGRGTDREPWSRFFPVWWSRPSAPRGDLIDADNEAALNVGRGYRRSDRGVTTNLGLSCPMALRGLAQAVEVPAETAELVFVCNATARRAIAWTGCLSGSFAISEQDSHGTRCWDLGSDKSSRPSTRKVIGALALTCLRVPPLWTSPLESER